MRDGCSGSHYFICVRHFDAFYVGHVAVRKLKGMNLDVLDTILLEDNITSCLIILKVM